MPFLCRPGPAGKAVFYGWIVNVDGGGGKGGDARA